MTDNGNHPMQPAKQGFPIGVVITGVLSAVIVIFIVQNTHDVPIKFLGWDFNISMFAIVFLSAFFGAALALTLGAIRRRSKRPR